MKRLGSIASLAMLAVLVGASVVEAAPTSPFTGSWTSIDPVDGSTQYMDIQGGASVQIRYTDEYATTCADIGAATTVFTGILTGRVSGNELNASFRSAGCGSTLVLNSSHFFAWTFEYDPNTDTLWGAINDGPATWSRE
jgi:hypothetical protein